uniref:AIG1-type G domain-containing protein n=1 Tax=Sphaeramia orbicularis TaxID=375764 RepID=A0A673ADN7_9TELE
METRQRTDSKGQPPNFSLVLVGSQRCGVNSIANGILGGTDFEWEKRTAQSKTHSAKVNGKVIQLVKAPVWLRSYHLCDTSELVKDEQVLSVTRCEPGPHAFILLVEVDLPFTSACANAVKAHLELYGENVWNHTIVLFTCGDWLDNITIEEYITGEGKDLDELLDRCGRRYVFDCMSTRPTLSQTLLDQVETLVERNGGRHFKTDENVIQNILQKREEVNKGAENRKRRIKHKKTWENMAGSPMSEVTIVMLGWVFTSKSEISSVILGIPEKEGRTETCDKDTKVMKNGLKVTVVDTPGWWKYFSASLVPNSVRSEIMKALDEDEETGHTSAKEKSHDKVSSGRAFLLMIPADTSFTNEQKKIIEDNMKPFGETVWQNTIVVFNRAQCLGNFDIEQHIEREGEALIWLVEQCGNRYFAFIDEVKHQSELEDQGEKLVDMVVDMVSKDQSLQIPSNKDKEQMAETGHRKEEGSPEEPVDHDLKKLVEVLHREWEWGSWEMTEFLSRFAQRPITRYLKRDRSIDRLFEFPKSSHTREEIEKILRDELCGRSLEEVLQTALQIYFQRECGAFDILSIMFEKDQFKSEWKQLFEREWARREERMMEYVLTKYFTDSKEDADAGEAHVRSCEDTSLWTVKSTPLKSSPWMDQLPPLIKEIVKGILKRLKELNKPVHS